MKQIRLALAKDAAQISDLRIGEFNQTQDFRLLKPELLEWSDKDEASTVIGIWHDETAVATLRLMRVADSEKANRVIEARLPVPVTFPGLVFNAAATRKAFRRRGFNQLLRYYSIRAAQASGIQSLLSPVYQSAPRISFMRQLGYECHVLEDSWQTKLAPNSPRMICILEEKKFAAALVLLEQAIPDILQAYPWAGPPIGL